MKQEVFRRWYRRWIEPRSIDEDIRRKELIFNILILGTLALLLLLYISLIWDSISEGPGYPGVSPFLFPIFIIPFAALYALSRRGYVSRASRIFVLLYAVFTCYAAMLWSIDIPIVLLSFAFVVILGSILISPRFGVKLGIGIGIFIAALGYYQALYAPQMDVAWRKTSLGATDGLNYAVIVIGIAFVAWLSNREIARSLHRARTSEAELAEEKNLLEVRVSERTQELRDAQMEKAAELYRFAEFGKLSSGLFHNFINAFNGILLDVEALEELKGEINSGQDSSEIMEGYLADALEGSKRMDRFAGILRKQIAEQETERTFSLNDAIRDAAYLMSYKATAANVSIVFSLRDKPIHYHGNELMFSHMISNLIANAIDAYDHIQERNDLIVIIGMSLRDDMVAITVEDHGAGISPDIAQKIFEPFFTTKGANKGMGIGLALTKKYVEQDFGGRIRCSSREGVGSTFVISFPLQSYADAESNNNPVAEIAMP